MASQLADLQHIPPSPELIRQAREAGVDANPVYAKFGVTGEFDSFKTWLENLNETADAPMICGRARSGERIVLVAAVRAGASSRLVGQEPPSHRGRRGFPRSVLGGARRQWLLSRRISVDGGDYGATISLPLEWDRPLFVQLVATGPNGPRPVAERWVGKIPEGEPTRACGSQSPEAWLMQLRRGAGARYACVRIAY